jgi:hypothetical protein
MIIDNRKAAIQHKFKMFIITLFFMTLIIIVALADVFDQPVAGVSKSNWIIGLIIIYLLVNFYYYIQDLNYLHVKVQHEKLIVRYISMRILTKRKKAVEIPLQSFVKYEITNSFLKQNLYLYQKLKNRLAKYPPVSITSLTKEEKERLRRSLDKLTAK